MLFLRGTERACESTGIVGCCCTCRVYVSGSATRKWAAFDLSRGRHQWLSTVQNPSLPPSVCFSPSAGYRNHTVNSDWPTEQSGAKNRDSVKPTESQKKNNRYQIKFNRFNTETKLKGIVHFEIKIWYLSAYPKGIQDVGVFFSSVDPILMFLGQTVLVCQSYNGRYRSLSL